MKKIITLIALTILLNSAAVHGQKTTFDISSPFKLWLLNNEARVFSSLSSDELLINRVSLPFSFMPFEKNNYSKAEEKIWEIHRKLYGFIDETQNIYALARRFGSGRFAIVFKQSRAETWCILPLQTVHPWLLNLLAVDFRKAFHATLLKSLKLDPVRDMDLAARLQKAVKKLADDEYRLLNDYFANFAALFPGEGSVRILKAFIETGPRQNFAPAMKDLLRPVFTAPVFAEITISKPLAEPEDPLAELEKLAAFGDDKGYNEPMGGEESTGASGDTQSPATLDPPEPGTDDLFNIWD